MITFHRAAALVLVLSVAACGDSALDGQAAPDGARADAAAIPSDAPLDIAASDDPRASDDGSTDFAVDPGDASLENDGAPLDAGPGDGPEISCGRIGDPCVNGAGCCSGSCDAMSKQCVPPPHVCAPQGSACASPTDCCSLDCAAGKCATQCRPNGEKCGANGDCCSATCTGGTCQPIVQGGCATLGNRCQLNADCCSQNCQAGLCAFQGGVCNAIGDICLHNVDCCSGLCLIPQGLVAGTCQMVNGGGGGNCIQDGEPCAGCSNCCSRVCAPTDSGGHICAPASGCKVIGDVCHQDTDCCGGGNTGLPGANSVTCNIIQGTNPPIGTCSNPNGCDPDGDVCGLSINNTCGNARHDCCDCLPPKINCCKYDKAGVPRCYGGSTQQCPNGYTGKAPCCIQPGEVCAFSSECCDGTPCVPDGKGTLRCGKGCQMAGDVCTADSDCCVGLPCLILKGDLTGKCQNPPPPPPPPDMAQPIPDGGVKSDGAMPDLSRPDGPAPDLLMRPCSLVGQSCSTEQPCCNGLACSPPGGVGVCQPGELDCTCVGSIG